MLPEDDHLGAGDGLGPFQSGRQHIGGRTIRASLGREQFHDHRLRAPGVAAIAAGLVRKQREHGHEHRGPGRSQQILFHFIVLFLSSLLHV